MQHVAWIWFRPRLMCRDQVSHRPLAIDGMSMLSFIFQWLPLFENILILSSSKISWMETIMILRRISSKPKYRSGISDSLATITYQMISNIEIWKFPDMGVPQIIHLKICSVINNPLGSPIYGNPHMLRPSPFSYFISSPGRCEGQHVLSWDLPLNATV